MLAPGKLRSNRGGFTLVEILVVIAIISILAALLAAGIFAVIANQRQSSTQNTMRAVYKVLAGQMKYVWDKADKEPIPPNVLNNLAGGDAKLARIIWKKLRLKQEFPMTFAEALAPYNTYNYSMNGTSAPAGAWIGTPPTWQTAQDSPIGPTDLPPLAAYVKAIYALSSPTAMAVPQAVNQQPAQPFVESSVLLLLALQQNRGGAGFSVDQLGSAAVTLNANLLSNASGNGGLKMLIDNWGNPIAFFRFPTSNDAQIPLNGDLDAQNPAGAGATFRDSKDPEGRLVNAGWNNWNNWSTWNTYWASNGNLQAQSAGVFGFEKLSHTVHYPNNPAAGLPTMATYNTQPGIWAQPSRFMPPTLVSAGPDGKWGLNNLFGSTVSYSGLNPDMSIDQGAVADSNDNIYSYRLGLGE